MKALEDPRPGTKSVTNTEEQDVAVNHSTVQEGGYDEPREQPASEAAREEPKPVPAPEKEQPTAVPRKDTGKRIYDEEPLR